MTTMNTAMNQDIKEEMTDYWAARAEQFAALRIQELESEMSKRWLAEIKGCLPEKQNLRILDIGTGGGYFCFLLAREGHELTGIDLTEEMIAEAKKISTMLGVPSDFYVMDAETPEFQEACFDVIITRNVTWTLPDLEKAYTNWGRILKKGGVLINFDGDYCREDPDQKLPENHIHKQISKEQWRAYEHLKEELRPISKPRPEWDAVLLKDAGFKVITVDEELSDRIYTEEDCFYNPTEIFKIIAKK